MGYFFRLFARDSNTISIVCLVFTIYKSLSIFSRLESNFYIFIDDLLIDLSFRFFASSSNFDYFSLFLYYLISIFY